MKFTTVPDETIKALKFYKTEIEAVNEMENTFGSLMPDEMINRKNYTEKLLTLIETL